MLVLITGVCGFIGSHVATAMLKLGHEVLGVDNINDYYDTSLKIERLKALENMHGFNFQQLDVAHIDELNELPRLDEVRVVIHLAAQAGVRYSLKNPFAYAGSNLLGHLAILELVRHMKRQPFLIYASSSSVYGNNSVAPFDEGQVVNKPVSLYAATKIADEMMSYSYANLYGINQIGLRFFTVYGPWGRPDMAYWNFADSIMNGKPIQIFNNGKLRRDFTYIDDIVEGIMRIALRGPKFDKGEPPHKIYNIGNNQPVELMHFIETIEKLIGKKAIKQYLPMQAGDVFETYANIDRLQKDYGFKPSTPLETGLGNFVRWFKAWKEMRGEI